MLFLKRVVFNELDIFYYLRNIFEQVIPYNLDWGSLRLMNREAVYEKRKFYQARLYKDNLVWGSLRLINRERKLYQTRLYNFKYF
jgi:hypothetical protein